MNLTQTILEDAVPNPEYLIKSIAEQGYSLETSLADLMDNSISANADKIEILIKMDREPFVLFLADNGDGMDEKALIKNMKFPSSSPDEKRANSDLGRFGLGMKTASFAQTRCFTVISRQKGSKKYYARTWDVESLKKHGWKVKVNSDKEINSLLTEYKTLSTGFLNAFDSFEANTIIVWQGLYKFEDYLEEVNRQNAIKKQITDVTSEYLGLVFHRFMQGKRKLKIRINNNPIPHFNPFPTDQIDFRGIEYKEKKFSTDRIRIEGFVLPAKSIDDSSKGITIWTTKNKGLMDLEGIYIYREDRIILFGGWNGLIKKAPRLQLARLRVDVGNSVDHLLHLNVAKSQVVIPHDLAPAFERYIEELKVEAEREYYNRGIRKFSGNVKENNVQLFDRIATNKGNLLELNGNFPLIQSLKKGLNKEQLSKLNFIFKMINTRINNIRQMHKEEAFEVTPDNHNQLAVEDLISCIKELQKCGFSSEQIKSDVLDNLGYKMESFPREILNLLT